MRATSFTRLPLRELQQAFAAAVLDNQPAVLAHVRDGIFPAARHVQVYRNNTFANLTDALAACYPVVRRLVGAGFFDYAADAYIRHHPPASGNLHDFGAELADFIAAFPPAQSLAYLPEVARLEWAWQQSYHAADLNEDSYQHPLPFKGRAKGGDGVDRGEVAATPSPSPSLPLEGEGGEPRRAARALHNIEALAAVAPEDYARIVFQLHPSALLLEFSYPCRRIWQVNQPDFAGDARVDLDQGGERLLVIRRGLEVEIETLGAGEHAMLRAFTEGRPLREATDAALSAEPEFDLGAALQRHIAGGTIAAFSTNPNR